MTVCCLLFSSAGVGRSGAFIVLDIMLERLPQTHDMNVYECVQNIRAKRMSMVQTVVRDVIYVVVVVVVCDEN